VSITSTSDLPAFELWPVQHRDLPGEWVFVPDGTGGGVVVGRVWQVSYSDSWIGLSAHGCGDDRRQRVRSTRQAAAEAVVRAWLAAGQPDARRAAEAARDVRVVKPGDGHKAVRGQRATRTWVDEG
jgi:hypothetical protein